MIVLFVQEETEKKRIWINESLARIVIYWAVLSRRIAKYVIGQEKDEESVRALAFVQKKESERERGGRVQWVNKSYVEQMAGTAIS